VIDKYTYIYACMICIYTYMYACIILHPDRYIYRYIYVHNVSIQTDTYIDIFMYAHICMYDTHVCIHYACMIYIYTYIHTCKHPNRYRDKNHNDRYRHVDIQTHRYKHTKMHAYTYTYMYVYVCMYVYIYVYTYIHTYIHTYIEFGVITLLLLHVMHPYIQTYKNACKHKHYLHFYVCMYVYIHTYVCMYTYIHA
jgi:hypothetical protein